jgi:hypothetical protein
MSERTVMIALVEERQAVGVAGRRGAMAERE